MDIKMELDAGCFGHQVMVIGYEMNHKEIILKRVEWRGENLIRHITEGDRAYIVIMLHQTADNSRLSLVD